MYRFNFSQIGQECDNCAFSARYCIVNPVPLHEYAHEVYTLIHALRLSAVLWLPSPFHLSHACYAARNHVSFNGIGCLGIHVYRVP